MRFRLATAPGQGGAAQGIGQGFAALGMLPAMRAQAAEQAQDAAMKRDLMGSQLRQSDAHAALFQEQANAERTQLERGGIGELLKSAALQNGVPLSQLGEATDFLKSGQLAGRYNLPGGQAGPTLPTPQYTDPGLGRKIMQTLGLTQQALTVGDKSVENIAKAAGAYQDQGITDAAVRAASAGNDMDMSRLNAIRGKKEFTPFAAVGTTGTALNQVTGEQEVANQALNALFGQGERAQINQRNAAAGASNASASSSRASMEKTRLETQLLRDGLGKGSLTTPKDRFEAENKLRDEFQKQTGTFGIVRDAFAKVQAASKDPNAASDIALIFAYMKILDPSSVVREGEFATAQNAGGIPDQVVNMYNRALNGERLNNVQRNNFVGEARKVYQAQTVSMKQSEKNYTELAGRYGLDVKNIVTPFAPVEDGGGKVVDFNALGGGGAAGGKVVDFGGLK